MQIQSFLSNLFIVLVELVISFLHDQLLQRVVFALSRGDDFNDPLYLSRRRCLFGHEDVKNAISQQHQLSFIDLSRFFLIVRLRVPHSLIVNRLSFFSFNQCWNLRSIRRLYNNQVIVRVITRFCVRLIPHFFLTFDELWVEVIAAYVTGDQLSCFGHFFHEDEVSCHVFGFLIFFDAYADLFFVDSHCSHAGEDRFVGLQLLTSIQAIRDSWTDSIEPFMILDLSQCQPFIWCQHQ